MRPQYRSSPAYRSTAQSRRRLLDAGPIIAAINNQSATKHSSDGYSKAMTSPNPQETYEIDYHWKDKRVKQNFS